MEQFTAQRTGRKPTRACDQWKTSDDTDIPSCLTLPENHTRQRPTTGHSTGPAAVPTPGADLLRTHLGGGQPEDAGLLSAATVNIFSSKSLFPRATEQQKSIWESTAFLLTLTETELEMPGSGATEPSPTIPSTRLSSRQTLTTDRP